MYKGVCVLLGLFISRVMGLVEGRITAKQETLSYLAL